MGSSYKWGESCARTMQLEREKGCVGKGASGCMPCMEKKMWVAFGDLSNCVGL